MIGCDPTSAQWDELSAVMMQKKHVVIFDSAYQVHNILTIFVSFYY